MIWVIPQSANGILNRNGVLGGLNMFRTEGANFIRDSQGHNIYSDGPPGACVEAAWLNSVQEEICNVIEWGGLNVLSKTSDTRDQLKSIFLRLTTSFDVVVASQAMFNNILERVSANKYQIKSLYKSVYLKNISGGYKMSGASSILSGGDTWGYIQTNQCTLVFGEPSGYIDMGDTRGYIEVNSDNCSLYNIHVLGLNAAFVVNLNYSFLLNANYVTYINCKSSLRYASGGHGSFTGSMTDSHNRTSKYIGCSVYDSRDFGGSFYGFNRCYNLSDCYVSNLLSDGDVAAFTQCININNSFVYNLQCMANPTYAFFGCSLISNCYIEKLDTTTGALKVFYGCQKISNCYITDIDTTSGTLSGFENCKQISNCDINDVDTTGAEIYCFNNCYDIGNCYLYDIQTGGNNILYGFFQCDQISGSYLKQFDTTGNLGLYGFFQCNQISSCKIEDFDATNGDIRAIYSCYQISSVYIYDIQTAANAGSCKGFYQCYQISACRVNQVDQTTGAGLAYAFDSCQQISACNANDIDSGGGGTAEGFHACVYGAALFTNEAANSGNDWIDTVDASIANKVSTPSVWT
jgi:hypothetical protein